MPVVAGAKRTVIQQAFDVQVTEMEGGKALVFMEPDGTARVYSLTDEAARRVSAELVPIAAMPQDLADLQRRTGRDNGR